MTSNSIVDIHRHDDWGKPHALELLVVTPVLVLASDVLL
jgi:hypothetical protein